MGHCRRIDGSGRPNLACPDCGLPVGSRIDDCGPWQVVRILPQSVLPLPGPPEQPAMGWEELLGDGALWHGLSEYQDVPAGVNLTHAVVAAEGGPVEVAPGPVAEIQGRALAVLLPSAERTRNCDPGSASCA